MDLCAVILATRGTTWKELARELVKKSDPGLDQLQPAKVSDVYYFYYFSARNEQFVGMNKQ